MDEGIPLAQVYKMKNCILRYLIVFIAFIVFTGCASTAQVTDDDTAQVEDNSDPWEGYNRAMFSFNRSVDKAVIRPLAKGYQAITPEFVDIGVTNFFSNLGDVVVIANDLLQLKGEQAVQDTVRFSVNSTLGLLGFIDIATLMGLPKNYEDFGQTLGYWGVGEGYYLVLPLLGPSTTRDIFQYPVDYFFYPVSYIDPTSDRLIVRGVELIDYRALLLPVDGALDDALDPYIFLREAYRERRLNLVHDGSPPNTGVDLEGLEDFIDSQDEQTPAESSSADQ